MKARNTVVNNNFDTCSVDTLPLPAGVNDEIIKETLDKVQIPEHSFVKEDKETQGHRLFTKPRVEDEDIRDAAFKLLQLGEETII